MVDHAHVPGVHDIGALLVLVHVKVLPGALFLHQGILVPAGLGAGAPVGVPAGHVVGQQAPAGVGHAHGPVGEGLNLQLPGGFGPDLRDLRQAQLPGQNHPVRPQVVPGGGGLIVYDAGLGADVDFDGGSVLLGQGQHPHVRQDHGGDPRLLQQLQPLGQAGYLVVPGHGVAGDVAVHPVGFAVGRRFLQFFRGEIPREGAHAEGSSRKVHGVGPVGHGHLQPLPVSGGGQQFQFFLHGALPQLFRKAWNSL